MFAKCEKNFYFLSSNEKENCAFCVLKELDYKICNQRVMIFIERLEIAI